jgi:hypothetical protein
MWTFVAGVSHPASHAGTATESPATEHRPSKLRLARESRRAGHPERGYFRPGGPM